MTETTLPNYINVEEENKEIARQYKELLRISYQTLTAADKKQIRKAFDLAVESHANQRRKSGEAYVFHPIAVARIVAEQIGLDATSIAAALLHDVLEDTSFTYEEMEQLMGTDVARIVKGLTKIAHLKNDQDISLQAENFRKMLLTMNDDVRVIIIKIADRLHNMQTMESMPEHKQLKIASETLYIYAPLAHRIGLYNVKTELEDLSLKYTEPNRYHAIKNKIVESEEDQQHYIDSFSGLLTGCLDEEALQYTIKGRSKSVYSIHRKMQRQNISFEQVFDKFAIRIIYEASPGEEKFLAWKIYAIVTDSFTPNPTRLRDWITTPKSTGYEALHVTVMGPQNRWVEVQIRSARMHEIAERGYAAHFKYKQGNQKEIGIEDWLNKLQEVLENNTGNAVDFVEDFKLNLYASEIFVFTPDGDIKSLPKGATALDFGFAIHTEIGKNTLGARVNNKLVPLSKELKSGDQVAIITSKNVKPVSGWLDFVKTSRARSIIKSSLNEEKKQIAEEGKEILRRKLKQLKINFNDKVIGEIMRFFKIHASQDLFYEFGLGTIDNKRLKAFAANYNRKFLNFFKKRISQKKTKEAIQNPEASEKKYDTLVFGREKEKLPHTFSPCCQPIPGDSVFGFISINDGVKVHKIDCPNSISLQSNYAYRTLSAQWIDSSTFNEFNTVLKLSGIDKPGLVNEATRMMATVKGVVLNKISFDTEDGFFTGTMGVSVNNKAVLNTLIKQLSGLDGMDKVVRE